MPYLSCKKIENDVYNFPTWQYCKYKDIFDSRIIINSTAKFYISISYQKDLLSIDTRIFTPSDKNRYVSAGVQIYSCFRLYSGGLTCSTPHIFPLHFPHFLVCGNIHNPDIGIVNVDLLCPFPVLFLTLMDYDFIHKCV